jgi:hypothetical protein
MKISAEMGMAGHPVIDERYEVTAKELWGLLGVGRRQFSSPEFMAALKVNVKYLGEDEHGAAIYGIPSAAGLVTA